jgi:hypothetical protein
MEYHGDLDTIIPCKQCGGEYTVRQLIDAAVACYRTLQVISARTPCCQSVEELWPRSGIVSRGYVYAAGQAHFADMENYRAPDLVVAYSQDQVSLRLDDQERIIERK